MIMVTAKITSRPGEKDKIILKSQNLIEYTRLETGCISYNLYSSTEEEDILLVFEQWENSDVLKSHMETEHFKVFNKNIKDHVAKQVEITVYSGDKI